MSSESTAERILAVLEDDAQACYAEIADRAGVSKPTVRKYIDQLEEDGVIVGYSAEINPKKLASQSIALVGMDVESEAYVSATQTLEDLESVRRLYTASGDHMLMAEVRAPNGNELGDIIENRILTIEGISAAHPTFLQERIK